jgi:hypothetical protein
MSGTEPDRAVDEASPALAVRPRAGIAIPVPGTAGFGACFDHPYRPVRRHPRPQGRIHCDGEHLSAAVLPLLKQWELTLMIADASDGSFRIDHAALPVG